MEDSIIVNYIDGTPETFKGKLVSDTKYPSLGLREMTWITKDGYSITLKMRKLNEDARKAFGCNET